MDIVHGHNWEVPKRVDLNLLIKIAVIVDLYGCDEAVEPFVDQWVRGNALSEHYILWLCMSWVFQRTGYLKGWQSLSLGIANVW